MEKQYKCIKDKRKMARQDGVMTMTCFVDHTAVPRLILILREHYSAIFLWLYPQWN